MSLRLIWIRGLAENDLSVYQYNPATDAFDLELTPVLNRDIEGNSLTVAVAQLTNPAKGAKAGTGSSLGIGAKSDTDGDGLSDDAEIFMGTNANLADTDGDGLSDFDEVGYDGDYTSLDAYDPVGNPGGLDLNPLAADTAERLAGVDCDVWLIHLNHSNPLHGPGLERDWLAARGIGVGAFGQRWRLG